jgi:hypothetical protein
MKGILIPKIDRFFVPKPHSKMIVPRQIQREFAASVRDAR